MIECLPFSANGFLILYCCPGKWAGMIKNSVIWVSVPTGLSHPAPSQDRVPAYPSESLVQLFINHLGRSPEKTCMKLRNGNQKGSGGFVLEQWAESHVPTLKSQYGEDSVRQLQCSLQSDSKQQQKSLGRGDCLVTHSGVRESCRNLSKGSGMTLLGNSSGSNGILSYNSSKALKGKSKHLNCYSFTKC